MFRFKVFIPVVLILGALSAGVVFYLDGWVKGMIEKSISSISGTKTDITDLKLSLLKARLSIRKLEIASQDDPMKNAVQFEEIDFEFAPIALLKKNWIVNEFSVKGIQWGTKRKMSGRLTESAKDSQILSWISDMRTQAAGRIRDEFDKLPLSQFTDFRIPSDPREVLDRLDLKSSDEFKSMIVRAQETKTRWTEKMKDVQDTRTIEAKFADLKSLAEAPISDPQDVARRVEKIADGIQFLNEQRARFNSIVDDIKKDAGKINDDYRHALEVLSSDFENAKSLVSIDQLNLNNFSRLLFGPELLKRMELVLRINAWMRQTLGASKKSEDVNIEKAMKGRDITFLEAKKSPTFVLEKSDFSIKGVEATDRTRLAQLYELKLRDINSSPSLYGKPSSVEFHGDFRDAVLNEIFFKAFWDYTTARSSNEFKLEAKKIKAEGWPMGIPQFFPLKISSGLANAEARFRSADDAIDLTGKMTFSSIVWNSRDIPKQGLIIEILQRVIDQIHGFTLEVELKSVKDDLDFNVKSDLDSLLKSTIENEVHKKIEEFQTRLKRELDNRVAKIQSEAEKLAGAFQAEFQGRVESELKKITSMENELAGARSRLMSGAARSVVPDGALKKLKKLF